MKRRDAIKTIIGSVLGVACAPLVTKAVEPSFDDKMAAAVAAHDWKPPIKEGDRVFATYSFQLKSRPRVVLSDYR